MARRRTSIGFLTVTVMLMAAGGCRLKDQTAPSLTGPSEFALSLRTTVVPDLLARDGLSQALITVNAYDETGRPKAGVGLKVDALCDTSSGRAPVDAGRLTAGSLTTGQSGTATTSFVAPSEDDFTVSYCTSATVYIDITPVGNNYQNTIVREVALTLIPDPQAPVAAFSFWPATPSINEVISFDGSASHAAAGRTIVSYYWQFGTDRDGTGQTIQKTYDAAATYYVTLTVTDDLGRKGQLTRPVTVQ